MEIPEKIFGIDTSRVFVGLSVLFLMFVLPMLVSAGVFNFWHNQPLSVLPVTEAAAGDNVSGYAWSENIGWVSFNCTDGGTCGTSNYGVNVDSVSGNLSGYAWSENIGWVSFNTADVVGCPGGTCQPRLSSGQLYGWAKALSAADGWDGYISLNCANPGGGGCANNYVVTLSGSNFIGYAWGGDVVGWLQFNPSFGGVVLGATTPPSFSTLLTATPNPVTSGNTTQLNWTATNATACTASGGSAGWAGARPTSGPWTSGALFVDTSYTIACQNAVGWATSSLNVLISVPPDFSLSSSNSIKKTAIQTDSSSTTITITPQNGFNSNVNLTASPTTLGGVKVNYIFSDTALTSAEYSRGSSLYVNSTSTVPAGSYTITVTGTEQGGSSLVRTVNVSYTTSATSTRIEEF